MTRVLIVDDEKPIRRILSRILGEKEFECVEAASVQEAKEKLAEGVFDLVLSDVNMPGQTGVDLVRYTKEHYPSLPVIMATVLNEPNLARDIIHLGVYGYVTKPFDPNQVKIQVFNALQRKKLETENEAYQKNLEAIIERRTAELQDTVKQLEQTRQELQEREELFRNITTHALDGIAMINSEGKITFWNAAAEKIFGYTKDEVFMKNLHDLVAPSEYRTIAREKFEQFRQSGMGDAIGKTVELKAIHKTGKEIPVELSVSAVRMKEEWHAIGIIRDVSRRKEVEEELKKTNAEISQIFRSMSSALIGVNENGVVLQWNPKAEELFGLTDEQTVGNSFYECKINWDSSVIEGAIEQCRRSDKDVYLSDVPYRQSSGKEGFLDVSVSPVHTEDNRFSGFILLAEDTTQRKILESQLAQAQKLESIGQLAAGIAHEINTPIQYVGDNTRFLQDTFADLLKLIQQYQELKDNLKRNGYTEELGEVERIENEVDLQYLMEEIPRSVNETLEGVDRVAKIVSAMKEFSHPGMEEKTAIDINRALESTITVSRNEWKYVADVETDFDPGMPLVHCLPGDINQVFLNIIVNAAHAIKDVVGDSGEKGKITISTRQGGQFAEIRIQDTGTGIPEEIRNRIFDPFFTTKEVGKGTGQGLAIAHNIVVQKHNGFIGCESEVGKGTTFIIRLPLETEKNSEPTFEQSMEMV